ncbi:MAG: hypothetical protein ACREUH_06475 [Burkholderiales bacterium]
MSLRDVRRGAAIAGAVLLSLPVIEVLFGARPVGVEHFATGMFGLWLVGFSAAGRL